MHDKSFIEKLIANAPLAIIVLGALLLVLGASGGWEKINLQIVETAWRIVLASIGAVLLIFGSVLIWRDDTSHTRLGFRKGKPLRYFDDSIWISNSNKNQQQIDSKFLTWDRCTILIWVYIPQVGINLRNAPDNRYLLSHHTGDAKDGKNYNAFHFRYSSMNRWEVIYSNDKAEYQENRLFIDDGLEHGWHQFIISWDRLKPEIVFLIDGGNKGLNRSVSFLPFWPQKRSDNVTVGAWVSAYPSSYCETKLASLWIYDGFFDSNDTTFCQHQEIAH